MIKTLVRLICVIFLLTVTVNGIAQSKPKPKSKPAATTAKPAKPVTKEEEVMPPQVEELEKTAIAPAPALPPLPDIDTVPPPNDELTKEIRKLMVVTSGIATSKTVMKGALESQRKLNSSMPDEFYTRMLGAVESGQISGYIENSVVKIYRQKFTVDEVKEVIKFYDSPIGKKMAAESAAIADSARIEGEKVGQYFAIKIIDGLMKEGKWK